MILHVRHDRTNLLWMECIICSVLIKNFHFRLAKKKTGNHHTLEKCIVWCTDTSTKKMSINVQIKVKVNRKWNSQEKFVSLVKQDKLQWRLKWDILYIMHNMKAYLQCYRSNEIPKINYQICSLYFFGNKISKEKKSVQKYLIIQQPQYKNVLRTEKSRKKNDAFMI